MTQRYEDDPEAIPGTKATRKAIIRAYTAGTHKADVQIVGSHPTQINGVRVATNIPAADVIAGRQCTVLFLDPSNQDDALVLTIQGALPSGGGGGGTTYIALTDTPAAYTGDALKHLRVNAAENAVEHVTPPSAPDNHAPIGGYYPGVLSTGIKTTPQLPYKGDGFTMATFYCRVAVAPAGAAITVQLRRNGANLGSVATIAIGANTGSVAISQAIADGDYFDIDITAVGTTPNEGSDLVWIIVP